MDRNVKKSWKELLAAWGTHLEIPTDNYLEQGLIYVYVF